MKKKDWGGGVGGGLLTFPRGGAGTWQRRRGVRKNGTVGGVGGGFISGEIVDGKKQHRKNVERETRAFMKGGGFSHLGDGEKKVGKTGTNPSST